MTALIHGGNVWEDPFCLAFLDSILGGHVSDAWVFADYLEEAEHAPALFDGTCDWMRHSTTREAAIRLLEPRAEEMETGLRPGAGTGIWHRRSRCKTLPVERTVVLLRGPARIFEYGMIWNVPDYLDRIERGEAPDITGRWLNVQLVRLWPLSPGQALTREVISCRSCLRHVLGTPDVVSVASGEVALLTISGPQDSGRPAGEAQGWICYERSSDAEQGKPGTGQHDLVRGIV